jgi:hypothetical protein
MAVLVEHAYAGFLRGGVAAPYPFKMEEMTVIGLSAQFGWSRI